jgi:catechol 2,3-dioxygenase-like lactoylglutathione lyase family enzyme
MQKERWSTVPDPLEALRMPIVPIEPRREFADNLLRRIRHERAPIAGSGATLRYFVTDVETAVDFYCNELEFEEELRPSPAFAMLYRGELRLLLSAPGAGHVLPDGTAPDPGGWNRMVLQVANLDDAVDRLRGRGVQFLQDAVAGVGVRHALLVDPSGNQIELFEPMVGYHERAPRSTS